MFFAVLQAFSFYLLIKAFPYDELKMKRKALYLVSLPAIAAMILTLSPLVFSSVEVVPGGTPRPIPAPGIAFFALVAVSLVISGVVTLIIKARKAADSERGQFKFLGLGLILMFLLIVFFNFIAVVFFGNSTFIPISALFIFPFVVFTSYAIVRHELLNVKIIGTEILTFLLIIVAFVEVVLSSSFGEVVLRSGVFIGLLIFGILLIRSVINEIRQREQLEKRTKELRETQKRELTKARELLTLKDEFVFIATHDLRTPVTAIRGFVDIIKGSGEKFSEKTKENFSAVMESSDRLNQLVNDLLEVARSESGTIKVEVKSVDIVEIIEKTVKEVDPPAKKKNVKIKTDIEKKEWLVMGDGVKLKEVMENLLNNGVKYNKPGGELKIKLVEEGKYLTVSISDTGYGIPKDHQEKVFQKFFKSRTEKTKEIPGTGLGLFVVRMLIEKMKGTITFRSVEDVGTTFTFKLQLAKGKKSDDT
jgi:signal transduction histidine kinase